jgi:hypothetical protein
LKLVTPDAGWSTPDSALAAPTDYVDVTFTANANTPYTFWMRIQALNNSKFNDSVWVQFSDALSGGSPVYGLNSRNGLLVNLATDSNATSLNKWGWPNGAYWLSQPATLTFATTGSHTLRIQVREDGVQFDQIVLSPATYLSAPPGLVTNDTTIVSKSGQTPPPPPPPQPPTMPGSATPTSGSSDIGVTPTLTWSSGGATSYDVRFGTANPPPTMVTGQTAAVYTPAKNLANGTTYNWQIVAKNSAGTTVGSMWSFTTAASATVAATVTPPSAPATPNPSSGMTGVSSTSALTWTSSGATSYDILFSTTNPPSVAATGLTSASYAPAMTGATTYYWQVVAKNSGGSTTGPVWSFSTTASTTATTATGTIWTVNAGGNLQAAIDNAQLGDTILLQAGATFTGEYILRNKTTGTGYITIRSSAPDSALPADGIRITPADASQLPKLKPPSTQPTIYTEPGAHHYKLMFLEIQNNPLGYYDMMDIGDGTSAQNSLSMVPHDFIIDRVYMHGDPTVGQKRAIALNSASTQIINCYISEIKANGQDSQAIAGWNGPGPYTISNNYLEASGENIMFGGADPSITNLLPSNITITNNYITKSLTWRGQNWTVKNGIEIKIGQHVLIDHNVIENNWPNAQDGMIIVFTVRDQDATAPWSTIADVTFSNNVVRHAAGFLNVLGLDDNQGGIRPSVRMNGLHVVNNLVYDINPQTWDDPTSGVWGSGRMFLILGGPQNVEIAHNTVVSTNLNTNPTVNTALTMGEIGDTYLTQGLVMRDNIIAEGQYGVFGDTVGVGTIAFTTFAPGALFTDNVLIRGSQSGVYNTYDSMYPTTTTVPPGGATVLTSGYTVTGTYANLPTTDSKTVGADINAITSGIPGVDLTK